MTDECYVSLPRRVETIRRQPREAFGSPLAVVSDFIHGFYLEEQRLRPGMVQQQLSEVRLRHDERRVAIVSAAKRLDRVVLEWEEDGPSLEEAQSAATMSPGAWLKEVNSLIREIENIPRPRRRSARQSLAQSIRWTASASLRQREAQVKQVQSECDASVADLRSRVWQSWRDSVVRTLNVSNPASPRLERKWPPELMPCWITENPVRRGPAKPVVSLGRLEFSGMVGRLLEDFPELRGGQEPWAHRIEREFPTAPASLPLLFDLDQFGGFHTTDVRFLQTAVMDLLTLVPAGRLRIDAFDPEHLGRSVDYLFGLGDASTNILGDAIWTTPQHVANVLTQLEEHVTYVTQKYLQGQYKTLTEYNIAAGEVSEPYRLLMLHDFPMGFSRDGRYMDEEALQRVQRLARVGRRAGVYVLATTEGPNETLADLPFIDGILDPQTAGLFGCPVAIENEFASGTSEFVLSWKANPWPVPSQTQLGELHAGVQRMFQAAADVRVDAATVSDLVAKRHEERVRNGLENGALLARPDDSSTWWHESTQEAAEARFGRAGARGVATLRLDCAASSSALIGGRTGSGKSVLIHAILASLITQYSPEELELYLVDLKEGVEFKAYASGDLPHARVVAIESNREFALSVLNALDDEIRRRGELIRGADGEHMDLTGYRAGHGTVLPRILLVIDEFQVLFEKEDGLHRRALEVLERIVRQGRAFGIHAVLASQSLTGSASSIRGLVGQIPNRIALASSESDSRMLLSDDNTGSEGLTRPGEGILNAKAGLKEANERFQSSFWTGEDRVHLIATARALADERGFTRRPVVFEGYAAAKADMENAADLMSTNPVREIRLPVGLPMSLGGPVAGRLGRGPGGNALIVDGQAIDVLSVALPAWMASGVDVRVINFVGDDPAWEDELSGLSAVGLTLGTPSMLPKVLEVTEGLVRLRNESADYKSPPVVVALVGAQRARQFDPNDYSDTSLLNVLGSVLRSGPEVGVHVIMTFDKLASLERRLSTADQREFGIRVLGPMAESDSHRLIDQAIAGQIKASQLVLDDFDRSITEVVRRYEQTTPEWGRRLAATKVPR